MRELKFRVWDGEKMRLLDTDDGYGFYKGELCRYNAPLHVVMQYTGLNDKNGIEIFEGDVVKNHKYIEPNEFPQVIKFGKIGYDCVWNGLTGFAVTFPETEEEGHGTFSYQLSYGDDARELEIIGNIYEHPHLLQ